MIINPKVVGSNLFRFEKRVLMFVLLNVLLTLSVSIIIEYYIMIWYMPCAKPGDITFLCIASIIDDCQAISCKLSGFIWISLQRFRLLKVQYHIMCNLCSVLDVRAGPKHLKYYCVIKVNPSDTCPCCQYSHRHRIIYIPKLPSCLWSRVVSNDRDSSCLQRGMWYLSYPRTWLCDLHSKCSRWRQTSRPPSSQHGYWLTLAEHPESDRTEREITEHLLVSCIESYSFYKADSR